MLQTGIRLKDKVAIVTGAAHGIGQAYALGLAGEGAKVVVADIDEVAAETVCRQIRERGQAALALKVDVSHSESTQQMASRTVEHFGRIDILINNAAVFARVPLFEGPFWEISEAEWDKVMAVNLKGTFLCIKAVLSYMRSQGKGKIINISSVTTFVGFPVYPHYVASKAGIIGLTRSLARAVGDFGINVNCIAPGATLTEVLQDTPYVDLLAQVNAQRSIKRTEVPEDLVGAAIFLASEDSDFITGQTLVVDGGRAMH